MVLPLDLLRPLCSGGSGRYFRRAFSFLLAFWIVGAGGGTIASGQWVARKSLEIAGTEGLPFNQPADIAVQEGKIHVLDSLNNRLCSFDSKGRHLGTVRGTAEITLEGALGLAPGPQGRFFVADSRRGRILRVSGSSPPEIFITLAGEEKGPAPEPTGLLYYGERLYVADNDTHKVRIFDQEGRDQGAWGGAGEGYGLFKYPFRLAVDPGGRIGVTDVLNSRIQFFTPKGEFLSSLGALGTVSGTLFRPGGMDIDAEGNVYIADNYYGAVQVFTVQGKLVAVLHNESGSVLALKGPAALKVQSGSLYAVEMEASRVSVFTLEKR